MTDRRAAAPAAPAVPVSVVELGVLVERLGVTAGGAVSNAERVDLLGELERVKSAAVAAQAEIAVDLEAQTLEEREAAGVPAARRGTGIASEVALAQRVSPHQGGRLLGFAHAMREMPHTFAALRAGLLSEWRATLLVRETAHLTRADRARVDAELMADPAQVDGWGDRRLESEARKIGYRLDQEAAVRRVARATADRRVTLRPAPDTMTQLSALLPVAAGVSTYAALTGEADRARAAGDRRTRGQIMADTLVQRVTGASEPGPATVEVQVVLSDRTLLGADDEAGHVPGFGPVPAGWARDLVLDMFRRRAEGEDTEDLEVLLRRLWVDPACGGLVATESRARFFPAGLVRHLDARDGGTCRTPWCDAPVRHRDHVTGHDSHGPTAADNGQGLCVACNHAKQGPGWRSSTVSTTGERHRVALTTPTGHTYLSRAPAMPGRPPPVSGSRLEAHFTAWTLTA